LLPPHHYCDSTIIIKGEGSTGREIECPHQQHFHLAFSFEAISFFVGSKNPPHYIDLLEAGAPEE
jgi:hypothetical protein